MEVPLLSESIVERSVTEMYKPCPSLQKYIHDLFPYIQKLLVSDFGEIYEKHQANNVKETWSAMQFGEVCNTILFILCCFSLT